MKNILLAVSYVIVAVAIACLIKKIFPNGDVSGPELVMINLLVILLFEVVYMKE